MATSGVDAAGGYAVRTALSPGIACSPPRGSPGVRSAPGPCVAAGESRGLGRSWLGLRRWGKALSLNGPGPVSGCSAILAVVCSPDPRGAASLVPRSLLGWERWRQRILGGPSPETPLTNRREPQ